MTQRWQSAPPHGALGGRPLALPNLAICMSRRRLRRRVRRSPRRALPWRPARRVRAVLRRGGTMVNTSHPERDARQAGLVVSRGPARGARIHAASGAAVRSASPRMDQGRLLRTPLSRHNGQSRLNRLSVPRWQALAQAGDAGLARQASGAADRRSSQLPVLTSSGTSSRTAKAGRWS